MNSAEYKKLTIAEFDRAAGQFDNNDPSIYNMCRKDYPDILEEVRKEEFSALLDAGCGTGAMLRLFQKDLPGKEYYGIDLSKEMIKVAKEQGNGISFMQGDCEALPYPERSFDVVTCSMSFHHYPDPQRFFDNVHKVLRPNGRLILRDMTVNNAFIMWVINHIQMPLINKIAHKGDVHCYTKAEVNTLCLNANLVLERFEYRKGMRMHAVIRKVNK